MFGSDILDIVIGMVFVFTFLSLIASGMNELIETILKKRAKDLERGIREMIGEPEQPQSGQQTSFVEDLYNHGLINSLFRGRYDPRKKGLLPSYIPPANFALAVLDLYRTAPDQLPPNLKTAIRTFQSSIGNDAVKLQKSIEDWYNNSMDRVAGWYKRRAQWIILALGVIITVSVNADSIGLANKLSNDANLRKALLTAAQAEAAKTLPAPPDVTTDIKKDIKDINGLGLSLGWADEAIPNSFELLGRIFKAHAIGWLLTAFAISLGAPFWFDVLKRIVAVRSTFKPEESKAAGGK